MNYDKNILEQVLKDLENERIRAEAAAEEKRREVYAKLPRVAEIDALLRTTVLDVIRASFGNGEKNTAARVSEAKQKNIALAEEREKLLCDAGYGTEAIEPKYSCEACGDTGYSGGGLCPCVINRYRKAEAAEINKNLNVKNCSFSDFDLSVYPEKKGAGLSPRGQMSEVLTFARGYAEDFGEDSEDLFLVGESGLGKTLLASCIARGVADAGFSVVYDTAFSVLGAYEDVKFGRSDKDTAVFQSCDLLVIDDFGCEMKTSFTVAALYNLINVRKNAGKKTIIVSALDEEEIKSEYSKQIHSRLYGEFVKLEFLGEDVRLMR